MKTLKHLFILLSLFASTTNAQQHMIVEHYSKEKGLPSNTIYSSFLDNEGFMWLGTWHGLCSFDGLSFTPYITRTHHLSDIPPRKVRNIIGDKQGNIWIRNTDNHLFLFKKDTESFHDIYNKLKPLSRNVQVIKIQLIDNNHLMILTRNKDLLEAYVDNNGKIKTAKIYDSLFDTDPATLKLKRNILGETSKYIYWIRKDLTTEIITKSNKKNILSLIKKGTELTSFSISGKYILAGTTLGEIYVINLHTGKLEKHINTGVSLSINSLSLVNGEIYYTTSLGLYHANQQTVSQLITPQAAETSNQFIDKSGKLWLYSYSKKMFAYDTRNHTSQSYILPSDSLFANMKFVDTGNNGLFILLRNGKIWHFDQKTKQMEDINLLPEFIQNKTQPHFFDIDATRDGTLWLSSTNNGIYKLSFPKQNFQMIPIQIIGQQGPNNGVRALAQVKNGDLWIGTRKGDLCCYDIKNRTIKQKFSKAEIGVVYHIMEDNKGNLWFSTKGAGLIKATPDALSPKGYKITRFFNSKTNKTSISSNRVYYTFQDSRNRIWVCTFYGGLNLLEETNGKTIFRNKRNGFKNYPHYELYTDVRSITEDNKGRLWVATTDGLMSFDGNFKTVENINFETYRERAGASVIENDIYTMYKDQSGTIWFGIFGNGLNRLDEYNDKKRLPRLTSFNLNEWQLGDVITSIIEDHDQCLWVCTETGIASLKHGDNYLRHYDKFAGFPNAIIEDNTSITLKNGKILVGCREGLLMFNPKTVKNNAKKKYTTYITDITVANRSLWDYDPPIYEGSLKYAEEIKLPHSLSTFIIEFTTPHFEDNNPIPFKYILEGYEDQWHTGESRKASYANIPPGHYKFRVKVDDNTSSERILSIVVLPPWWATWWAYTIYTILTLLLLYGAFRLVAYMIKMRNEVYINDRLAELKIRFFTNVSHELRTPLSLINGPITEIKATEHLSAIGMEYLNLIERNARKMLILVNQILDFRKIQNGKMKLHVSFIDINEMITMLMRDFRILAEEKDISFSFECPDEHIMAWIDAEKIGIVLNNLISNAFKYTAEGGTICIAINNNHDNGICTIRVEDNGAAIPTSQLDHIFERFYQADNKIKGDDKIAGTGIGLSLSKEYVTMHHGKIWAENNSDGKGVAFIVQFPVDKNHFSTDEIEVLIDDSTAQTNTDTVNDENFDKQTVAEDINTDNPDRPVILLIEDNLDMCRMLQIQLKDRFNVYTAHEGGEGLEKTYRYHPDIIITDLMMPGMNGLELLHSVRQDFSISHIPVIVLTAKNTDEDKMEAIKGGANAFITKPFNRSYLVARIDQLLEEQRIFQRKMVVQSAVDVANDNDDSYQRHLVQKDIEFVHKIHKIIEDNLNTNDFNIDTIAGTIGLSRSAFFKKLKSLTGFAPVDLVREIRLTKATRLIENTDGNIAEIAYSVGFRDAGYFGKCFRKKYGMTPKEYRKNKNGE